THVDVERAAAAGRFRADLYYRLHGIEVRVPPLRERPRDVGLLAQRFLDELTPGCPRREIDPAALAVLARHAWPGNVRELRNVVQSVALMGDGELHAEDLAERLQGAARAA